MRLEKHLATNFSLENIRHLRTEGKREQAIEQLRALSLEDTLKVTWKAVKLAGEWLALEEYDEAERIYDQILTLDPDHPWAHRGKARVARRRGLGESLSAPQQKARNAPPAKTTVRRIRLSKNVRENSNLMHIGIVGNCQVSPLSKLLSAVPGVGVVKIVPLSAFGSPLFARAANEFRELSRTTELNVISQVIGNRFEDFETPRLKEQFKVMTVTNVHFTGLHPDITYVGEQGRRLPSPIGDYHSKLIVHSFVTGLSEESCRRRFCAAEYERVGYFSEYELSAQELMKRDEGVDIPFAARFLDMIREVPSLYTVNHPTGIVIQELASLIAARLGLSVFHRQPLGMAPNDLEIGSWFPVYPELGEAAKLKYSTPMRFKQSVNAGGQYLDLDEMIAGSYQFYAKNRARIVSSKQVVAVMKKWGR